MTATATRSSVPTKEPKDQEFEDLLRAVTRERMDLLGWGTTDLEKKTGLNQGNLHRWFTGERKSTQVSMLRALMSAFKLDPLALFSGEMRPEARYWEPYVPQHRDQDGPGSPRRPLTRAAEAPGEKKSEAEHHPRRVHRRNG